MKLQSQGPTLLSPPPKLRVLSPLDELLWAVIGLLLTVSGVFVEVSVPVPVLTWPIDFSDMPTYSLISTLQVGAVLFIGCVGGKNAAALSQIAYLALGLSGVQVFAQGGGLGYWQEPTFGYLLGFLPAAWLCGYVAFRQRRRFDAIVLGCLMGLLVIHVLGLIYLSGLSVFGLLPESWWSTIQQYSIAPLPGQLLIICAVTLISFLLRCLLFY
ncbi:MAG: biotin transporter BioY [Thermosynechococcaceae cyanobacterium]